jgi:hypothetical protein
MLGKMVYELQPKIDWAKADDLEIADRAADFVLFSPTEVEQLLSILAADRDHAPSERKPCPTSHSSTTTSIPAPRACGSR